MTNAGALDYAPTTRVKDVYLNIAYNTSGMADRDGWGKGGIIYPPALSGSSTIPAGSRIADITDGTSNTTMIAEVAARNALYRGRKIVAITAPSPADEAYMNSIVPGLTHLVVPGSLPDVTSMVRATIVGHAGSTVQIRR